jgi:hypothetical protein
VRSYFSLSTANWEQWRRKFAQAAQIFNYSNTKNARGSIGWASHALPLKSHS